MTMRLAFMGSPAFSVPVLNALHENGYEIAAVYTQPPRPSGRGKKVQPTPVHLRAEDLGLVVRHPDRLKAGDVRQAFYDLELDVAVVVAYGLILPKPILASPKHGCINIHASLLPRWRGAAPIHRAIMAADSETGVMTMQMEAGLDTGPVFETARTEIKSTDTTGSLHDRLSDMGASLILSTLQGIAKGDLKAVPQADDGITYAEKINTAEARIDWSKPSSAIDTHIRGLSPSPGAWFEVGDLRCKAILSQVCGGTTDARPGTVLDNQMTIACGEGAVRILSAQKPGKKACDAADFLQQTGLKPGDQLT